MRIFISGSRGYLGSALNLKFEKINQLIEKYRLFRHADFSALGLSKSEIEEIRDFHNGYEIEECDLKIGRDILTYDPNGDIDIVYHMAGQAGAIPSNEDRINDARQNILGTIRAIDIANKNGARLIFPASAAAPKPESPYGLSKKAAEDYIRMLCDDYVILRLSSIYGQKPVGVVDNFIRAEKCVVYGDGSAVRDFVHVDDIMEAFVLARYWDKGTYDCGRGIGTRIIDLAKATGKEIMFDEKRKGEIQESILPNTTPNWEPKIDVINYIKENI